MKSDRRHRIFAVWFTALTAALLTASCSLEDEVPDYRYRLTIEVETPEGLKSGSSVIEVEQKLVGGGSDPGAGQSLSLRVRGEAVAVDLPDGQTLYALLRSENNIEWAGWVYLRLNPCDKGEAACEDNVLEVTGEQTLPRMWRANVLQDERSAYPTFVTFDDEADPTSVKLVDPDDLAASFGAEVALRRIIVELTDDRVTKGIEDRLGWLGEYPEPSLKPGHGLKDYSLAATLKHGAFRQGVNQ